MDHKIHELPNGIKIQEYNNGSYGFWLEGKGWRNIPKQLGETLVKKFSIPIVSDMSLCDLMGHNMYSQYSINNFHDGGISSWGVNKCSRCDHEDHWQYDHI